MTSVFVMVSFSYDEGRAAIRSMSNDKSPGAMGAPPISIKKVWPMIGNLVVG